MPESFPEIYHRSRKPLILIGITQVIFIIITIFVLYELNLKGNGGDLPSSTKMVIINASLLGFLGSLLFFSRKVYIYLITDKFHQLMKDQEKIAVIGNNEIEKFKSIATGYYIYLCTRPIAGFVIGPLLLMFVLAGLTTFSKPAIGSEVVVSTAGMYLIYVVSFIGGYSSSDLFDYFSNLGGKLISKLDVK